MIKKTFGRAFGREGGRRTPTQVLYKNTHDPYQRDPSRIWAFSKTLLKQMLSHLFRNNYCQEIVMFWEHCLFQCFSTFPRNSYCQKFRNFWQWETLQYPMLFHVSPEMVTVRKSWFPDSGENTPYSNAFQRFPEMVTVRNLRISDSGKHCIIQWFSTFPQKLLLSEIWEFLTVVKTLCFKGFNDDQWSSLKVLVL